MRALITGAAGVIGSSLAIRLIQDKYHVIGIDNLTGGKKEHLSSILDNPKFTFYKGDIFNNSLLDRAMTGVDVVYHFAAKSDIKTVGEDDFKQNATATYRVLESMKKNKVKKIVFSSSSAVYGEPNQIPTPENYSPLEPISLYGASKLSSESLIAAYSHLYEFNSWIFRFANIVCGKNRKKGTTVITDFVDKLKKDNKNLPILGDGRQKKSYLYVEDCIDGILTIQNRSQDIVNVLNLGTNDSILVNEIAQIITKAMNLKSVNLTYSGGKRGWPGDVPLMLLDSSRANKLGWRPKYGSLQAVELAVSELLHLS